MALALYQPDVGYYAKGSRQVGREGDFYTSVSVGPLFGQLLARRFVAEWQQLGQPSCWRITESGAHDGQLAKDVLDAIACSEPDAWATLQYAIPEPLDSLRAAQSSTLKEHTARLHQVRTAEELEPLPGIVFGNELLDALPCHLVEWDGAQWRECHVDLTPDDELDWILKPVTEAKLAAALQLIGEEFPPGYRTEVRTQYAEWLEPLARSLEGGRMIWIDYGFERSDYYHPGRRQGTLRTFDHHQSGENPLADPGAIDISAHVDFSAVAEAAASLGGRPAKLEDQGAWLTRIGRDWLLEQEGQPDAKALRQFQTLTHPGHLGRSFQVLEINFWR